MDKQYRSRAMSTLLAEGDRWAVGLAVVIVFALLFSALEGLGS